MRAFDPQILKPKVQALLDRIRVLEGSLIEANNTALAAQAHLILIRDAYMSGCNSGVLEPLRDAVFVATKDLPPSKHEQALRDVLHECGSRYIGGPGENLERIHDIVREALK